MNNKHLKELLKECLDIEQSLYVFCIDCLQKIYGDKSKIAIYLFEKGYEGYDKNGFIGSLYDIERQINKEEIPGGSDI